MTIVDFIAEILRYFIGFFLLAAAIAKLRTYAGFHGALVRSFGVRAALASAIAPAVIALEALIAALVLGLSSQAGMRASLLMFSTFCAILGYKFFTQSAVSCGCFGEQRVVSGLDLLRNVFVLLSIAACLALGSAVAMPVHASILAAALASILCVGAIEFHDIVTLLRTD